MWRTAPPSIQNPLRLQICSTPNIHDYLAIPTPSLHRTVQTGIHRKCGFGKANKERTKSNGKRSKMSAWQAINKPKASLQPRLQSHRLNSSSDCATPHLPPITNAYGLAEPMVTVAPRTPILVLGSCLSHLARTTAVPPVSNKTWDILNDHTPSNASMSVRPGRAKVVLPQSLARQMTAACSSRLIVLQPEALSSRSAAEINILIQNRPDAHIRGHIEEYPTTKTQAQRLGIQHCQYCLRPCSGEPALIHHNTKRLCAGWTLGEVGKDVCLHCGRLFYEKGGLAYHMSNLVCGNYSNDLKIIMKQLVQSAYESADRKVNPKPLSQGYSTNSIGGLQSSPALSPSGAPYTGRTVGQQKRFQKEILAVVREFAGRRQDALALPAPERNVQLTKLQNSLDYKRGKIREAHNIRPPRHRKRSKMQAERSRSLDEPIPLT